MMRPRLRIKPIATTDCHAAATAGYTAAISQTNPLPILASHRYFCWRACSQLDAARVSKACLEVASIVSLRHYPARGFPDNERLDLRQ